MIHTDILLKHPEHTACSILPCLKSDGEIILFQTGALQQRDRVSITPLPFFSCSLLRFMIFVGHAWWDFS